MTHVPAFTASEKEHGVLLGRNIAPRASFTLQEWMAGIEDSTLLSAISIPGTHDSSAFTSRWPFVSTQTLDIQQQLDVGIRYFDLRCGLVKDAIEMVHGRAKLGLHLDEVLQVMYDWLEKHRTEALIVQIKQDRKPENSEMPFSDAVVTTVQSKQQYWRTHDTTPKLGDVRGRIQLFRRFSARNLRGFGINVSRWPDNPAKPFTIHTWHGVELTIQDHYSSADPEPLPKLVAKKGGDVSYMLGLAVSDANLGRWYINFASAFEINVYYQVPPREMALGGWWRFRWVDGINPRLYGFVTAQSGRGRRRYGIVVMDFPEKPEADLVASVIASNFQDPQSRTWWTQGLSFVGLLLLVFLAGLCIVWRLGASSGDVHEWLKHTLYGHAHLECQQQDTEL